MEITAVKPANGAGTLTATAEANARRAIEEVRGAMLMAKQFPRDVEMAITRIKTACMRTSLAEVAMYEYPRGDTRVKGPSIRLAEALAQNWGNMQVGVSELAQDNGESSVMAFAWDLETNTRAVKTFQVPHVRYTKDGGVKPLTDPRDIYEAVANQGARRLRACILSVIPGDVVELAVERVILTKREAVGDPKVAIKKISAAFSKYGVTDADIERFLRHKIEAVSVDEVIRLRDIGTAIRDGFSKAADYFPKEEKDGGAGESKASAVERQKEALRKKAAKAEAKPDPKAPATSEPPAESATVSATEPTDDELMQELAGQGGFVPAEAKSVAADPEPDPELDIY